MVFGPICATAFHSLETFSDADLEAAGVPEPLRSNPDFVRKGTTIEGADLFATLAFSVCRHVRLSLSTRSNAFSWNAPGRPSNTLATPVMPRK